MPERAGARAAPPGRDAVSHATTVRYSTAVLKVRVKDVRLTRLMCKVCGADLGSLLIFKLRPYRRQPLELS